jgi:hypothetical protein
VKPSSLYELDTHERKYVILFDVFQTLSFLKHIAVSYVQKASTLDNPNTRRSRDYVIYHISGYMYSYIVTKFKGKNTGIGMWMEEDKKTLLQKLISRETSVWGVAQHIIAGLWIRYTKAPTPTPTPTPRFLKLPTATS